MDIVLASENPGKLKEFREFFKEFVPTLDLFSLRDFQITLPQKKQGQLLKQMQS